MEGMWLLWLSRPNSEALTSIELPAPNDKPYELLPSSVVKRTEQICKMSMPLQLLLRLPSALRCHATAPLLRQPNICTRFFSKTIQQAQSKPPKPTLRRSQQGQSQPQSSPKPAAPPPRLYAEPRYQGQTPDSLLRTFYSSKDDCLLLYKAPSHTSFYFNSYILGSALLGAALIQGLQIRDPPQSVREAAEEKNLRPPLWLQALNGSVAIFLAALSTACFLAPWKLVRSVSLVKNAAGSGPIASDARVRFEMKHPLPILQKMPFTSRLGGGALEAEVGSVFMDRNVRSSEQLRFHNVPFEHAQAWTADYLTPSPQPTSSILDRLRSVNSALVNVWPALRQNIRRMLTRDGIAYVRIPGNGNWKMDLHGCELLDEGKILGRAVQVDAAKVDRRITTSLWNKVGP